MRLRVAKYTLSFRAQRGISQLAADHASHIRFSISIGQIPPRSEPAGRFPRLGMRLEKFGMGALG
jgi:hypothetical protein